MDRSTYLLRKGEGEGQGREREGRGREGLGKEGGRKQERGAGNTMGLT